MGVVNIISDIFIIVLLMQYLYKLRIATHKKLFAMFLFGIGIMTWVITIYRQTMLPGLDFADMTYAGVLATPLFGLERSVAIALACIPLLRPLCGGRGRASKHTGSSGFGSSRGSNL
ncbi:hypothetical protein BCR34DRAFT_588590 [Clohesyomyces aquaticus]|uniref:Rhodopsin domain-containing protein n=1 Tax=Clohesyomyces aquaticus TaxID=1231657 RepID=A0A1Y1ZKZ7_9PLEO|nr:hypothetical protein BCR34DRAFT_588590 [Clohesyomyces aquaticus]